MKELLFFSIYTGIFHKVLISPLIPFRQLFSDLQGLIRLNHVVDKGRHQNLNRRRPFQPDFRQAIATLLQWFTIVIIYPTGGNLIFYTA